MPGVHAGSFGAASAREARNERHLHGALIENRAARVKLRGAVLTRASAQAVLAKDLIHPRGLVRREGRIELEPVVQ